MIQAADKYRLRDLFLTMIQIGVAHPGRPGFGWPCSQLLEAMLMRQDKFLDRIAGDYTGDCHEYRLNGAGLKMIWDVDKETGRFYCSVSGDQRKDYPEFAEAIDIVLYNRECHRRKRG